MLTGVANAKLTPMQQLERLIHSTLLGCGLSEVSTYSFISPKAYDRVRLPAESEKRKSVVITNAGRGIRASCAQRLCRPS